MSEQLKDFLASTTLNGDITDSDLTLVVASAANFPTGGTFDVRIDNELLTVTGVSGTTFTVTRAAGTPATTAVAHYSGATVKLILTKRALDARVNETAKTETLCIAVSDETTTITTGTAKVTFRMPWACTLTAVRASLTTASSSGNPAIDINEGGVSVLSTTITIDANELTSVTAATPAVISDSAIADDALMTIDIDTAGTGAKGLKVYLYCTRTGD